MKGLSAIQGNRMLKIYFWKQSRSSTMRRRAIFPH